MKNVLEISSLFLFVLFFSLNSFSDDPPQGQIAGYYGNRGHVDDLATCLENTEDGGFIICGYTDEDVFRGPISIIRIDAQGNIVWKKELVNNGGYPYNIIRTNDNSYIIAGGAYAHEGIWLFKIDGTGQVLWQKAYGSQNGQYNKAYNVQVMPDGMYMVSGTFLNPVSRQYMGVLLKIDSDGNMVWKKFMELPDKIFEFRGIYAFTDGSFLAWGVGYILKFDANGNMTWARQIKEPDFDSYYGLSVNDLIPAINGDLLLTLHSKYNDEGYTFIMRLSSEADQIVWKRTIAMEHYPDSDFCYPIYKLFSLANNRYLGFGILPMEFDENGNLSEKQMAFSFPLYFNFVWDTMAPAVKAPDGNIAFCGSVMTDQGFDFGFAKTSNENLIDSKCAGMAQWPMLITDESVEIKTINDFQEIDVGLGCVDTNVLSRDSLATGTNTFCPTIKQVNKLQGPFRLELLGDFLYGPSGSYSSQILIDGIPVPQTTVKSATRIIAKKDEDLKKMMPKGVPVCIQVHAVDSAGGEHPLYKSDCFTFTR